MILSKTSGMSHRDQQLLILLSMGFSVEYISGLMFKAKKTIDAQIGRLKKKNNAINITHLVAMAIREKVID